MAAARSIGSATLHFDKVAIPVKYFTAVTEKSVGLNMLHARKVGAKKAKCGSRVKQPTVCEAEQKPITDRSEIVMGYEYTPQKFVTFTSDELKAIELEGDPDSIRIEEIVPAETVPLAHVRKTFYLGPDKGGDRAYALIATALGRAKAVAVGRIGGQRRDQLVIVRPHENGLALHDMFYANEVRAFAELGIGGADFTLSGRELELADELVAKHLVARFDAARFSDEAAARFQEAVARKLDQKEIVVPKPATAEKTLDLIEQLERSVNAPLRKTRAARSSAEPVSGARRTG